MVALVVLSILVFSAFEVLALLFFSPLLSSFISSSYRHLFALLKPLVHEQSVSSVFCGARVAG